MSEENRQLYYYHGDHLGSAQIVTDPEGEIYEQLEYTPYGELWVEHVPVTEATPFRFTGKERDGETGLYYYGARYLNPQTSMWLSADPAMGEYIPQAPVNDEAKKHNENLPGLGGVFNYVNLHAYHYAGNNPVKLVDPNGRDDEIYDLSGNHIRTVESDTNHVYVQKPNIRHGYDLVQLQDIDVKEFNRLAALIYAEAAPKGSNEEAKAMGEVVRNRMDAQNLSITDTLDHKNAGFDGFGTDRYDEGLAALAAHELPKKFGEGIALKNAVSGAIHGLFGMGIVGAYFWTKQGTDLGPEFEIIKTIGGSHFWRYREQWKKENRHTNDWP
jgi:RHS repeat-associated protein